MTTPEEIEEEIERLIEQALRTPSQFTPRRSLNELAVLWQARAVRIALKQKGIIQ